MTKKKKPSVDTSAKTKGKKERVIRGPLPHDNAETLDEYERQAWENDKSVECAKDESEKK